MKSLRGQLVFFWVLLIAVCITLAVVMLALFGQSAGAQIAASTQVAERACNTIASRYAKSLPAESRASAPKVDLLNVLLQLVLIETPRVEGGVWSATSGFLAYAYPTYEGSGVKRDVPEAEQGHIAELARSTAEGQKPQTDVVRASREALVLSACPLLAADNSLAAWTMTRAPTGLLDAQESLRIGLAVLLAAVLASGLYLGTILLKGWRRVQRLEAQVDDETDAAPAPLNPTGVAELDRIVGALNRSRARSAEMQRRLKESERQRARDQRLATLGRMVGGVAHEIRNPIAAMRLKAENAMAMQDAPPAQALQAILGQIERLDVLVQRLLAIVQPLALHRQPIDLAAWLQQRLQAYQAKAAARNIRLVDASVGDDAPPGRQRLPVDPLHLERAVDNLLDNALQHARREVRVAILCGPQHATVQVSDDGAGVPAALLDELFEPFATGRPDGTGLGLAMAREVALAHGGDLRLVPSASASASGATFELTLPWQES